MEPLVDDIRLLALAASVSDGTAVDWDAVKQQVAADDTEVVEQLRLLHSLAAAHTGLTSWGSLSIIDAIGHGSFATVYRASDPDLQRDVALKVIRPRDGAAFEPEYAVSEARRLARVRHPNVVMVYGAERRGDDVGIEMELINGQTLHALVTGRGPFSATEATLIGIDVCGALAAIHAAGVLHGDIKAHNVIREDGGRIVLMDLGAGRDLTMAPRAGANDFVGTPLYVAPEVFGGLPRSRASDIYSLGVLLYYLATGSYPVEGDTRTQIQRKHQQHTAPRPLRDVRPDLPEGFIAVVERAMAETPEERYQTAGEFERELRNALGRPAPTPWHLMNRKTLTTAAALVAASLAGLAYWSFEGMPRRSALPAAASAAVVQPPAPAPAPPTPYQVEAAVYRAEDRGPVKLAPGARVAPGDRLFVQIQTSVPSYTFVVNEDEVGQSFLLFPLKGQSTVNPLPPNAATRLPGILDGEEQYWTVSTVGKREHFLVFVTPEKGPALELASVFASLPSPTAGMPVLSLPLPAAAVNRLRGIGGLVPAASARPKGNRLIDQYTTPLPAGAERTAGLWVRTASFDNPER